jgi:hypothetical protein
VVLGALDRGDDATAHDGLLALSTFVFMISCRVRS